MKTGIVNKQLTFFTVPPSFLNNAFLATQTTIIQEEDVSIKCEVQGDPPLHISWKRKGRDIVQDPQFTVSRVGHSGYSVSGSIHSTLILKKKEAFFPPPLGLL